MHDPERPERNSGRPARFISPNGIHRSCSFGAIPTSAPPTLNEVRENLSKFSVEWKGADYARGQAQGLWREFFQYFGIGGKSAVLYEHQVKKLGGAKASSTHSSPTD